MKKIIIITILILSIISCKIKGDEPTPKNVKTNTSMEELNNTTWLLIDQGDNNGSYLSNPNYINQSINVSTLSYKDSILTFKMNGNNITWTATYYLDNNNWLYYYYNPKKVNSTFVSFGLQYNVQNSIMYQTNSSGEYQKYLKQ